MIFLSCLPTPCHFPGTFPLFFLSATLPAWFPLATWPPWWCAVLPPSPPGRPVPITPQFVTRRTLSKSTKTKRRNYRTSLETCVVRTKTLWNFSQEILNASAFLTRCVVVFLKRPEYWKHALQETADPSQLEAGSRIHIRPWRPSVALDCVCAHFGSPNFDSGARVLVGETTASSTARTCRRGACVVAMPQTNCWRAAPLLVFSSSETGQCRTNPWRWSPFGHDKEDARH